MEYPDITRLVSDGRYFDKDGKIVSIVDREGGIVVHNELTAAIHDSKAFSFSHDGTIAGSSSLYFLGTTGNKKIHFDSVSGYFQKGDIRLSLYEAPLITANGTLQTPTNMDFNSSITSTMALYLAPTITDEGTKKTSAFLPLTGVGVNLSPAAGSMASGRTLKQNTEYLFVIENTDSTTCSFGIDFTWHDSDII